MSRSEIFAAQFRLHPYYSLTRTGDKLYESHMRIPEIPASRNPISQTQQSKSTEVQKCGSPEVRQSENPAVKHSSDRQVRTSRGPAVQQCRIPAVRQSESPEVQQSRSPALPEPSSPEIAGRRTPWTVWYTVEYAQVAQIENNYEAAGVNLLCPKPGLLHVETYSQTPVPDIIVIM